VQLRKRGVDVIDKMAQSSLWMGTPNGRRSSEIGISHMHAPRLSCLLSDAFNSPMIYHALIFPANPSLYHPDKLFIPAYIAQDICTSRAWGFSSVGHSDRRNHVRVRSKNPASRLNMKACEGPANVGLLSIASSRLFGLEGPKKRKADGPDGVGQ